MNKAIAIDANTIENVPASHFIIHGEEFLKHHRPFHLMPVMKHIIEYAVKLVGRQVTVIPVSPLLQTDIYIGKRKE